MPKLKEILKTFGIGSLLYLPFVARAGLLTGVACPTSIACNSGDLPALIVGITNLILAVAGAIAVLFVIIGGFQYITSAGNEERAEAGKRTLQNAIIGVVVIVLSFVIIAVVSNELSKV